MSEDITNKVLVNRIHVGKDQGKLIWQTPYQIFEEHEVSATRIFEHLCEYGPHTDIVVFADAMRMINQIQEKVRCVKKSDDPDALHWIKNVEDLDQSWKETMVVTCEHGHCEPWENVANGLFEKCKRAQFRPVWAGIDDLQRLAHFCNYITELALFNEEEEE